MFRSSDTFVAQARSWLPNPLGGLIWFGAHAAHSTVFVPVLVGMAASPDALACGWQGVHNDTTMFWAARDVLTLMQAKFSLMLPDVRAVQLRLERQSQALVDSLVASHRGRGIGGGGGGGGVGGGADEGAGAGVDAAEVTRALTANAAQAVAAYGQLARELFFKFADGYVNEWVGGRFSPHAAGMEWSVVVRCGAKRCGAVRSGAVWCGAVRSGVCW
jgi:hypothetical protein